MSMTPITRFQLYVTPFDPEHKNVTDFKNIQERNHYFDSLEKSPLFTDAQYIRKDDKIIVPACYDEVERFNYVVYDNMEGLGPVYAFIIEKHFLSFESAELTIKTDVWQDNLFKMVVNPSFVRRSHIQRYSSDGKILWDNIRTAEQMPEGNQTTQMQNIEQLPQTLWGVLVVNMSSTAIETRPSSALSTYTELYIPFNPTDIETQYSVKLADGTTKPLTTISDLMKNAQYPAMLGFYLTAYAPFNVTFEDPNNNVIVARPDGVSNPAYYETDVDETLFGTYSVHCIVLESPNKTPFCFSKNIVKDAVVIEADPTTLRNKTLTKGKAEREPKLYCYPSSYMELKVGGQRTILMNEDFDNNPLVEIYPAVTLGAVGVSVAVKNGKRDPLGIKSRVNYESNAGFGLRTDKYQEYMLNNSVNLVYKNALTIGNMAGGMKGVFGDKSTSEMVGGIGTLANEAVNFMQMKSLPDTPRGSSFSALQSIAEKEDGNGVKVFFMKLNDTDAEIMNDRFTATGYAVNRVVNLSPEFLRSRYWFNYVQTEGVTVSGVGCITEKMELERIFNNGVTIYHCNNGEVLPYGSTNVENAERIFVEGV